MSIIRVEHIGKTFNTGTPISDVSFELNEGDVVSVIGPSGCGKSTLIRMLNMLVCPTKGKIYFHDECVNDGGYNLSKLREKVGMVFQSFNLFSHKNVMENIIMAPMDIHGLSREDAEAQAEKLLHDVGLYSRRDRYADELSGGQRQRAAIARCLAMDPEIILFDEPTSALDPTMVDEVKSIIKKLAEAGKTMMIVTHDMDFARSIANRVFYIDQGTIYEEGSPDEIFDHPQKERTIAFMKRSKDFKWNVDISDVYISDILDELSSYARKNDIPKRLAYRMMLVVEEMVVSLVKEDIDSLSIFAEFDSKACSTRLHFYLNGNSENAILYDELRSKIFDTYCQNIVFAKNDAGCDMHISFDIKASEI